MSTNASRWSTGNVVVTTLKMLMRVETILIVYKQTRLLALKCNVSFLRVILSKDLLSIYIINANVLFLFNKDSCSGCTIKIKYVYSTNIEKIHSQTMNDNFSNS